MTPAPSATYRLQLHPGFDFDAAAAVVGYLAELGVSHLYLSPVLQAVPGSTHGYDVVDHSRPRDELGGAEGHARLVAALAGAGLGQVLDIVPNHMAIGTGRENRWWWDVLENGPSSRYASHFDVNWDAPEERLRNTVLMPILGDHYGTALDAGDIVLRHHAGEFTVHYLDHVLPVAPPSLAGLLAGAARRARSDDLAFIAAALRGLPEATRTDPAGVAQRHRDARVLRHQLARLLAERPEVGDAVDRAVDAVNADVDALDRLLEAQNYRLAHWRTAGRELGYRRFFDITTLVGLRVEDEAVFADTHELILRWVRDGVVDGLRVDHPDGLRDPEQYFDRLSEATGGVWVAAEKILAPGEELPETWPVAGTTGYDRLAAIGGLFVDPDGEGPLTEAYGELTGAPTDLGEVVRAARAHAVHHLLAADVNRLTALLVAVCQRHRHQRDRTRHELHEALQELLVAFPVYRTYVRAEALVVRPADVAHVEGAVRSVGARRPDIDPDLLRFLADLLLLRVPGAGDLENELVMQFQQLTGPAMAKGVEDTAFYRFDRLLALNEVGSDPGRFGVAPAAFHETNVRVHQRWPATMTTLSTHDTKRSGDARARLALLSEIPGDWAAACRRWMAASARLWPGGDPDRRLQHLVFQTLVGAWPVDVERSVAFVRKATKEAKLRTSWTEPGPAYDAACEGFVRAVAADEALVADIAAFAARLLVPGRVNALAQVLLAHTVPGVPDTYQGDELWNLSLVDPDNRRPVDFDQRRGLLDSLPAPGAEGPAADVEALGRALADPADPGLPKLRLVRAALHLRRRRPEAFGPGPAGAYTPLEVTGSAAAHAVALGRGGSVAAVVPRLVLRLAGAWGDTAVTLPHGEWRDLVTGAVHPAGPVRLAELLDRFPVALLERPGSSGSGGFALRASALPER